MVKQSLSFLFNDDELLASVFDPASPLSVTAAPHQQKKKKHKKKKKRKEKKRKERRKKKGKKRKKKKLGIEQNLGMIRWHAWFASIMFDYAETLPREVAHPSKRHKKSEVAINR